VKQPTPQQPTSSGTKPGDEVAPGTPQSGEAICPQCAGAGRVADAVCPSCGGSGKITALVGDA
jgi:DnaJ-class molecular chaperone